MRLKDKRAIVTGGGSGIGFAIAQRFCREGAAVAIVDVNASAGQKAAEQFRGDGTVVCHIVGDVSKANDASRMVQEAVQALGGLDILVNNAGIDVKGGVADISDEDWERQLSVNLGGPFRMTKAALPHLQRSGGGAIVNIASIAAHLAFKGLAAYGASKGAVLQLTRNMATDLAQYNIRANSVSPGVVDTPLLEHACKAAVGPDGDWIAFKQAYVDGQLLRRAASPAEIANAVLFLASDEASFITGADLLVDGGMKIQE